MLALLIPGVGMGASAAAEAVTLPTTIRRTATAEATLGKTARSAEGTMGRGSESKDVLRRTT